MENVTLPTGYGQRPFRAEQPWLDAMVTHRRAREMDCPKPFLGGLWRNRLCHDIAQEACAVERAEAREDDNAPPRLVVQRRRLARIPNVRAVGEVHRRVTAFPSLRPLKKRAQFIGPLPDECEQLAAFYLLNCGSHRSPRKNILPSSISPAVAACGATACTPVLRSDPPRRLTHRSCLAPGSRRCALRH